MKTNFEFLKNDVDPEDQVFFPYYFDGANKEKSDYRVMFIGNSITYHEIKPEIGWNRSCGMAASDIDHDYVHIVFNFIKKKHPNVSMCVFNASNWENDNFNDNRFVSLENTIKDYKPDLIIVRLGENFSKENLRKNLDPTPSFIKLFNECKKATDKVIVTSLFWHQEVLDSAIKKATDITKVTYIDINDLGEKDENKAYGLFSHPGICGHPGDIGMQNIAKRIIEKL